MRVALMIRITCAVAALLVGAGFAHGGGQTGPQGMHPVGVTVQDLQPTIDPSCGHFGHFLRKRLGEELWSEGATSLLNIWDEEGPEAAAIHTAQLSPEDADPAMLLVASAAARVSFKYDLSRDLVKRIYAMPSHPLHDVLSATIEDEEALAAAIAEGSSMHGAQRYQEADRILVDLLEANPNHWRAGVISYLLVVNTYFGGDLERFHDLGVAHLLNFPHYPFNARILHLLASKCNLMGDHDAAVQYIHLVPECSPFYREIRHVELKAILFKDASIAAALQSTDPSMYDGLLEEALEIAITEEDPLWFHDYVGMTRRWAVARDKLDWGTTIITQATRKARDQGLISQAEANRIAYHHLDMLFIKIGKDEFQHVSERMLETLAPQPGADHDDHRKFLVFDDAVATYYGTLRSSMEEAASAGLLPISLKEIEQ